METTLLRIVDGALENETIETKEAIVWRCIKGKQNLLFIGQRNMIFLLLLYMID